MSGNGTRFVIYHPVMGKGMSLLTFAGGSRPVLFSTRASAQARIAKENWPKAVVIVRRSCPAVRGRTTV